MKRLTAEQKAVALDAAAASLSNWIEVGVVDDDADSDGSGLTTEQVDYISDVIASLLRKKAHRLRLGEVKP